MLSAVILGALSAGPSGVLVAEGMGIGVFANGKWTSLEMEESPDPKPGKAAIEKATVGGVWQLSNSSISAVTRTLGVTDFAPLGNGWGIDTEDKGTYWFGTKPAAVKTEAISKSNAIYRKVITDFLATKGYRNAKPVVDSITKADLDGNGTDEVILVFGSKPISQMRGELNPYPGNKFPAHYTGMLIRYATGSRAALHTVWFKNGREGGLGSLYSLRGIWNLDGQPGAEVIVQMEGWEDFGFGVFKFRGGKATEVAGNGWGV